MQGTAQSKSAVRAWRASAPTILILGILLVFAFRGPLAGRMFYLRDISQNHYPMRHYVTERLRALSLPLWDPYHGGGTPLLANPDALVLHPISALFLFLPFDAAFTASIVLQFALLAFGAYLLARQIGIGREGATLAAAVLSLSGPAASLASLQNVLSAAAWVPLSVFAFLRGLEPMARRWLPLAALCLAVVLMTGEPASALGALLLASGLALASPGSSGSSPRERLRAMGALAAVLFLGVVLAAAQILPARELLRLSTRGAGFSPEEGMKWSLEPARLLEVVLPRIFGDPTRLSPLHWWGRFLFEGSYPFLLSIYVGIIPCLLAAIAICRRGTGAARRLALAAIAGFAMLLALGRHTPLYRGLFAALPAVRQVRYPERFLLITLLAVALLAGEGLDLLLRGEPVFRRRAVRAIFAAAALLFVGTTLVAAWPALVDRMLDVVASVPAGLMTSEAGSVLHNAVLRSSLWAFASLAVLALGAGVVQRPLALAFEGAGWGIVAMAGLSMLAANGPALSTAAPGWIEAPSPLARIIGHGPGAPRLHHEPRPEDLSVWATTDELAWGYRFDRFTYTLLTGHRDQVPTILDASTDRMDLAPQAELGRALGGLRLPERVRILSICGVGFVVAFAPLDHPDLEPVDALEGFSLPAARVYRLRSPLPRARFASIARPLSRPDYLPASLADPGFEPRREVLLDGIPAGPGGGASDGQGGAAILEDLPEKIVLRAEAPAAGYLVLSDAFAPGWSARVDGTPAPILRANGLFRAVRLDPGSHEVIMLYRPRSVLLGLGVSLCGALIALAWWWRAGRRHA